MALFRRAAACGADAPSRTDAPLTVTRCACPGRRVVTAVIDGGGHSWPGGRGPGPVGRLLGLDRPSSALDATAFLVEHLGVTDR